ncbi:MAG: hypothetical protein HC830_04270 [Bacteroidetes bacterium]|nr:hypothetical protein [Bacteroidota bacterium]
MRTKPGELFSKSNIIRSVRELAQLGHFDPEKLLPILFQILMREMWMFIIN